MMSEKFARYAAIGLLLFLVGCAITPQDTSPARTLPPSWGWNIGAGDLFRAESAACRLGVYLDELTVLGGPKRIRIVYTPETGPFQLQHWIPVIRAKGYRLLLVLSQSRNDKGLAALDRWIREGVVPIADLLDGVQLANEPDGGPGYSGMEPLEFARWHFNVARMVRAALPGVPIIGPDLYSRSVEYVKDSRVYIDTPDLIVSLHVSGLSRGSTRSFVQTARSLTGKSDPVIWVTEGRKRSMGFDPGISQGYVYVYNCNMGGYDASCEPETRRPGGGVVEECEVKP